jgi:dolichyl-phosphate beta-glucosyltransferase
MVGMGQKSTSRSGFRSDPVFAATSPAVSIDVGRARDTILAISDNRVIDGVHRWLPLAPAAPVRLSAPALSIVIPAYREAWCLARSLDKVCTFLDDFGWLETTEIVLVTADAPDETVQIARREIVRFPHHCHLEPGVKVGKGRDVRCGMLVATGALVIFMDADLATPLHHLPPMIDMLQRGCGVVIGTRDLGTIHDDWTRKLSSQLANQLVRWLLLPGLRDTQCGFKGFRREVVDELFGPMTAMRWGFDFDILARGRHLGLPIGELFIGDWCDPKGNNGLVGEPAWSARLSALRELVSLWVRWKLDRHA